MSPWPQVAAQDIQIGIDLRQHGSWISTWPLVVAQTTVLCTSFSGNRSHSYQYSPNPLSCFSATDQDLALGNSSGMDITLYSGGQQAVLISFFLTTFTSSNLPLFPAHEAFCLLPSSVSCTRSPKWCPMAQCQASCLGQRWCLVESCPPQSQGMMRSCCFSSLKCLGQETSGNTQYDGARLLDTSGSWLNVFP